MTEKLKPIISKNWGFDQSFEELCKNAKFCFRFPNSKNKDDCRPHFVIETGERLTYVIISNDRFGIIVNAYGSSPKSLLTEKEGVEITNDGETMVLNYLIETNAHDLITNYEKH